MKSTMTYSMIPVAEIRVDDETLRMIDLPRLAGSTLSQLPLVLRLLLENVARNMTGTERHDAVAAILAWPVTATSEAEVAFQPDRVLMHDTTSTPALVDIAAMRDVLAEAGRDPMALNTVLPVDVSVDHSLAVDAYARPDAMAENIQHELQRNAERYRFLRWASKSLRGVRVYPPGTGIMHTINLEQLATVVTRQQRENCTWAVPDTMLGTDSHTPMINGIGVLGWGIGGLEAQTVMFGIPTTLRVPDVVGVRFTGALQAGATATDLALTVTQRLRELGMAGEFVEYFGPGVAALTAGQRAVVANMAPEYGATTGYFPIDERTLDYLRETGRDPAAIELVHAYAQRAGLWFDPSAEPRFTRTLEIGLGSVGMHVAGPRRPQDLLPIGAVKRVLREQGFEPAGPRGELPRFPVAIAAITSCTNTSDPALLIAAGLVARNARRRGLRLAPWVKTSLSPGSPAATDYLLRAGLREDLAAVGFNIVGFGCATCIGNSGPIPAPIHEAMIAGRVRPVAALSGNRNFPGRVHPDLDLAFLMSPPLVVAFALLGDAEKDLSEDPVGFDPEGRAVSLQDLWPTADEVAEHVARATRPDDYRRAFRVASGCPDWHALAAPQAARFPWDPASNTLRRPPFVSVTAAGQLGIYTAWPLLVVGDDITTDHISPASAIPRDSLVADYLTERGEDHSNLNVFASRRGNWEVMLRAAFHSKFVRNLLQPGLPVAHTVHAPSGELMPLWQAAERYHNEGRSVVLVAGERYGTGSSRDWAAKGQRLLGIRAVLANSFERIHRSNLVGMGVLPLRTPAEAHPDRLKLLVGDRIEVDAPEDAITVRGEVPVRILRRDGRIDAFTATAALETLLDVALMRCGGVIPYILRRQLSEPLA